jgi:probable phosphoglycerate mutase
MSRLFLLRHGRALLPDEKRRFIGQTDLPLSEGGLSEARAAGRALEGLPFERFLSSDLLRAARTAEEVSRFVRLPILQAPCLREIDLGSWEGLVMEEVKRGQPEAYEARGRDFEGYRPPGGESFSDLAARTLPLLEEMSSLDGNVLVVGHSGVFRVFLAAALGVSVRQTFLLSQDTGGIHVLAGDGKSLSVERLNWKPSLQQAGTR